eukprot:CAMPEP_0196818540 /NCGR_PEP_ID=MMETSP1362-20130617/66083_1 /TAXON_ID=163516 /ORGANISM="Leptocylindrus danicus, Strain CCMP1856" /LENGTH=73 /DNA_ID=CAMNT_0042196675 /DNA_START=163 /DNA_END=384 /DNA_ORIENTATION=+
MYILHCHCHYDGLPKDESLIEIVPFDEVQGRCKQQHPSSELGDRQAHDHQHLLLWTACLFDFPNLDRSMIHGL